jgi:CheY-like chemotaxis protein
MATHKPADLPLVLVAEDHEINRTILSDYLQANRLQVITAADGEAALLAVSTHQPAIILLDIQLPVIDGLSVIQQLRTQGDRTPILVITGMANREDHQRCLEAGATGYLSKPFQLQTLLTQVRQILAATKRAGD